MKEDPAILLAPFGVFYFAAAMAVVVRPGVKSDEKGCLLSFGKFGSPVERGLFTVILGHGIPNDVNSGRVTGDRSRIGGGEGMPGGDPGEQE